MGRSCSWLPVGSGAVPFSDERRQVVVLDRQPTWAAEYEVLANELRGALGSDVQVRVATIEDSKIEALFSAIGFRCRPEPWNLPASRHFLELPAPFLHTEAAGRQTARHAEPGQWPARSTCNSHHRQQVAPGPVVRAESGERSGGTVPGLIPRAVGPGRGAADRRSRRATPAGVR